MTFAFEKLRVYQKSVDFADAVCTSTEQFQCGYGFQVNQLNRASLSISSNFDEGNGRFTKADRKHFFGIARASVLQRVPQLELARRRGLIDESKHAEFKSKLLTLGCVEVVGSNPAGPIFLSTKRIVDKSIPGSRFPSASIQ